MPGLAESVRYLRGVGPHAARRLERLGILTVRDLLFHVPRAYRDRRAVVPIGSLRAGVEGSVAADVVRIEPIRRQRGRQDLVATLRDPTGFLRAVWFNQGYRASALQVGTRYVFSGTVHAFRGLELHNPEFEPEAAEGESVHMGRIAPRYALTEGITERWLRARVRAALDGLGEVPDMVPGPWRRRHDLPPLKDALEHVHFPPRPEDAEPARRRLALEEILTLQMALQYARRLHRSGVQAVPLGSGAEAASRFLERLPFAPTRAQSRALGAIHADLDQPTPMRRLLLGDVGSGKTVVALAAVVRTAGAGRQAAILAPTALLAEQHAASARRFLEPCGLAPVLLTGATRAGERAAILDSVARGETRVLVGTHALLEKDIAIPSLGLVVVDEQHRFGVRQRLSLLARDARGAMPHLLVLTATPIPRTLALTLYGDLDVSLLDEKPPGRIPVRTEFLSDDALERVEALLRGEVRAGGSAFVVYPVIEESERQDLKAATAMADALGRCEPLRDAGVVLAHGRLPAAERRLALDRFRSGEARVLVATTVIEVGLDIPDATLVVINHPERFGLAQLHQIRGRVGRADRAGRCVLVQGSAVGPAARDRLRIFARTQDGFRLAEEDLRLRGPGELLGTSQHGFAAFRVADPLLDLPLIESARDLAAELLEAEGAGRDSGALRGWIEAHFAGAERYLGSG